ncbi:hypothetical protein CROQUDRAFT_665612 [Cronartium quercuum f. sp. fusiforme G11]|uniref:rRNA methyltransferase 2, mitochondrial n=1 Tax=Cronartium quercuum f. sp. fusiforme G11 TaxID=708437 RepID=A0A9P6T675_9BASI|nr:hypothetical protein CROQUDRAFT_665612 [Cronartium quercuum f. sp. fusiforme G11]
MKALTLGLTVPRFVSFHPHSPSISIFSSRSFHTLSATCDKSASSKRYVRRAQTDPYGKAKSSSKGEKVYIARSAHKLIQLDQQLKLFPRYTRTHVLDLGAAPGGWTEVALERLGQIRIDRQHQHRLIACDLLPLTQSLLANVPSNTKLFPIQGDFLKPDTHSQIINALGCHSSSLPVPTIILSDLLGSLSGIPVRDAQNSLDLCLSVIELAKALLRTNGPEADALVIKHIQSGLTDELRTELSNNWQTVKWIKPLASRSESREGYFVARDRKAPQ